MVRLLRLVRNNVELMTTLPMNKVGSSEINSILKGFPFWLQSPKKLASLENYSPKKGCGLASFFGNWCQTEKLLEELHLLMVTMQIN